jgi:hypothetical protein
MVAERYRVSRQAQRRFPEDVREVLTAAGWAPGRDVSAWVRRWLEQVHAADPDVQQKLPLFPAAQAALAEFGGLRFTQMKRVGVAGGGFRVETWPDAGRVVVDLYAEFAADLGVPVFPFAWYEDGPSDVVVDARGRMFLLHPTAEFLIADSVDAAVTALVSTPEFRLVDDHGDLVDTDRGEFREPPYAEPPTSGPVGPTDLLERPPTDLDQDALTGDWEAFSAALGLELATLPENAKLIIYERSPHTEHFAQFVRGDELRAEVTGATVGDKSGLLSFQDQRLLDSVGWQPPEPQDGDDNWWRHLPRSATDEQYARLARAVVTSLRDVNGVRAPGSLLYYCWEMGGRLRTLRLPGVGPGPHPLAG